MGVWEFYTFTPCYAIVVTNKRVRELDIDLKLEDGILDFLFTEWKLVESIHNFGLQSYKNIKNSLQMKQKSL